MDEQQQQQQHRSMVNVVSSTMTWDQSNFRSHSLVIPSVSITSSVQQDAALYHSNSWKEQLATSTIILSEPLPGNHPLNSDDQPLDLTCARKRRSCSDEPESPLDLSLKKPRLAVLHPDLQPLDFANNDARSSALPPSGNFDNPILVDDAPSTTESLANWKFSASKLIQFAHLHNSAVTQLTPRHLPPNCSSLASSAQNFHVNLGGLQQHSGNFFFPEKQTTEVNSSLILHGSPQIHPEKFCSNLEGSQQYFVPNVPSKRIDFKHVRFHEMGSNLRKLLKKEEAVHQGRCSDVFDACKSQNLVPLVKNNNPAFARNLQIIVPPNYSKSTHFEAPTPFPERSEIKGFLSTPHSNRTSTLSFAAGMENTFAGEPPSNRSSCKVLGHRSSKKIPVANVQPFMKAGLLEANEPIVIDPSPPPPGFQMETQGDSNQSQTKPSSEQTCCFIPPQKLSDHQESELLQSGSMSDESRVGGPCTSLLTEIREDLPSKKVQVDQIPASNSCAKVSPKEGKLKRVEKKKISCASAIEYIDDDMSIQDHPSESRHKQKRNCFRKSLKRDTESTPPSSTSPSSSSSSSTPYEEHQKLSKKKHQQKQHADGPSNQVLTSTYDKVFQPPASKQPAETSSNQQPFVEDETSQQHESASLSSSSSPSSSSSSSSSTLSSSNSTPSSSLSLPPSSSSSSSFPSSSSSLPIEGVTKEDNIPGKALSKPMEDLNPSNQSVAATEMHPGAQPSCSRFRGSTDRRGRGGKRKNSKRDTEVAASSMRSSQPPFYGFFTSPLRSSNRGRCRKNPQTANTCRTTVPSLLMTSVSSLEGISVVAEKNIAETRLHQATRLGCEELVWHFLSAESVHANVQNNNGTTPLHISATSGDVSISSMLLSYGAQPNAKALDGTRPLHNAVLANHVHLVRLLLTYGADPNLTNFQGKTPIQLCRTRKMRNFLRGFSNDVNGCGESLWGFSDAMYNHCDSFLSNLPDDDDVDELHFDVFSSAPLSVYHVFQERSSRLQPCHLLTDVCKALGTTQKFCSKKLNIVESSKVTREPAHAKQSDSVVKFVAVDNQLRKLMKTETFKVHRWIQTITSSSASFPDKQTSDDLSTEDRKKTKKKQNVVESLSKLAKICKNTSSGMVDKRVSSTPQQKIKPAPAVEGKQKTFESNNCSEPPPLLVLDKHEAGPSREETSAGDRKSKSEEMEMPQLTLYS